MIAVSDLLRGITLLSGVGDEHIENLAARATRRHLEAGEWLFHEGDPGEALFVIGAGSIDIVAEEPQVIVLDTFGRGEAIGELSLLTGQPRSVGARARRDTDVICIAREEFERLLGSQPDFSLTLVRVLGERLRRARPPEPLTRPPRVIAVLPLHEGAPVQNVVDQIFAELRRFGTAIRLNRLEDAPEALDRLEADNRWVVLSASSPSVEDPWTRYCRRQADRVVGLASRGITSSATEGPPELRGCDVAILEKAGVEPDLDGWMEALDPRTVYVLREGDAKSMTRMARRLAARAIGVVFSGGGARGFAHIGVVEALQQAGVVIDRIGSVSIGAMVGSLFARPNSPDEVAAIVDELYVRTDPLSGRTIPIVAVTRGARSFERQHELHGERRIEGLDIPFYCVSSDLAEQAPVIHRRGLVANAVSASQALPGFVPPLKDGERLLVDGAIFSNLPVEPMRATAEGPVIAIDVSGRLPKPRPPRSRFPALRRWIVGPAAEWAPHIAETVMRSVLLGNVASDAVARERADLVIQPRLRGVPTMRFRDLEGIRRLGREAANEMIEAGGLEALQVA